MSVIDQKAVSTTPVGPMGVVGLWRSVSPAHRVVLAGVVLIATQLVMRGWAIAGGWFYADDFEFLTEATDRPLTLEFLLLPHDSQLMPGGRLTSWLIAAGGPFNWSLAALSIITLQAVASLACLWMLVALFGERTAILVPLSFYLFASLTVTAFMWWSAAINQLPVQAAAFLAVGAHAHYLRSGRFRWAAMVTFSLVVGLLFYVKTVLIVLPLVLLTLVFFVDWGCGVLGGPWRTWRRSWKGWTAYAFVVGGYLLYYVRSVPQPLASQGSIDHGALIDAMFRRSLASVVLGGPWRWANSNPPVAQVDTPEWAATAAMLVLGLLLGLALSRRSSGWKALAVVVPYLGVDYLLAAFGRGAGLGTYVSLELRYLADAAPFLVVAGGLLLMQPLTDQHRRRAPSCPASPERPFSSTGVRVTSLVACGLALAGAVYSTITYVGFWREYPARTFVDNAISETIAGPAVVLDATVPDLVQATTAYPDNLPSRLLVPLRGRVTAVTAATDPSLLSDQGTLVAPFINPGAASDPGPDGEGCGYLTGPGRVTVAMAGEPQDYFWWASVSYAAGSSTEMSLTLGERVITVPVERGLHRFFVEGRGGYGPVTLQQRAGLPPLCVDQVHIGDLTYLEQP